MMCVVYLFTSIFVLIKRWLNFGGRNPWVGWTTYIYVFHVASYVVLLSDLCAPNVLHLMLNFMRPKIIFVSLHWYIAENKDKNNPN